jgi:dihydroflavonol-4-reductase
MERPWALVTGANGFIGSRLVRLLIERGERVRAFVRAESDLRMLRGLPKDCFSLSVGDVQVEHTVYRALAGCDRMYHVAAAFKLWDRYPERILNPTIEGTRATLEAARKRKLRKVVVTSSVAALGVSHTPEPMDEEHEFNLQDPESYVEAKFEAEQVAIEMAEDGVPIVVVQPSTVVGPGDWKPTPSGTAIVRYLSSPSTLRLPITEGGVNIVDVDDVALGHLLAMDRGSIAERYIIGGDDLTFREIIETLSDLTDLALPGRTTGSGLAQLLGRVLEWRARSGGPEPIVTRRMVRDFAEAYAWVTSAKAEQELGYTHRPAREALARSVRWYLEKGYVSERAARRIRLELRST